MDFTYLYDQNRSDFGKFSRGKSFEDAEVYADIGRPEEWVYRAGQGYRQRSEDQAAEIAEQLARCGRWGGGVDDNNEL